MEGKIKVFALRSLLLVAKSFVYVRKQIAGLVRSLPFAAPLQATGQATLRMVLWLVSPAYQLYRLTRQSLDRVYAAGHSYAMRSLSHRYVLHLAMLIITITTITSNLTLSPARAENFGPNSLIFDVVGGTDEDLTLDVGDLPPEATAETPIDGAPNEAPPRPGFLSSNGDIIFQPYFPTTQDSIAPRQSIEEYVVEDGDTLAGIAARFRLQLTTLLSSNKLTARSVIRPGLKLLILPVDGVVHTIKKNEQIASIAKLYQVTPESILSFNRIANAKALVVGQTLIIPGGRPLAAPTPVRRPSSGSSGGAVPPSAPAIDSGARLLWPAISHRINQYYSWRHSGVDIHGKTGDPIYASEDGVVLESRWGGSYGNMLLVKHDNGLITRYGHASKLLAGKGERVTRGQRIGLIGSTGRSTGPHIHYEVYVGSTRVNPLGYTK